MEAIIVITYAHMPSSLTEIFWVVISVNMNNPRVNFICVQGKWRQAESTTREKTLLWREAWHIQGAKQVQCSWSAETKRRQEHGEFCIYCIICRAP